MNGKFAAFAVAAIAILLAATPLEAQPPVFEAPVGAASLYQPVAGRCARLIRRAGRETLINACNSCQMINISRKRAGIAVPVMRSYNVPARSEFPVPFRGPGRSRITSVTPCEGESGSATNLVNPRTQAAPAPQQCVSIQTGSTGGLVLVNKCSTCRAAAVQRVNKAGKNIGREGFRLQAHGVAALLPKGASGVGLLAEAACSNS